ncbi:MAG: glycosyltransferase family 4 protein [Deltaproteobacteria bacterium]|nr:glycosyltransferase family 4 protein [Deltaproteobacteria bacterium]
MSASAPEPPRAPLLLVASSSVTGPAEGQIALARLLRARGIEARIAADTVKAGDVKERLEAAGVPWIPDLSMSRAVWPGRAIRDVRVLRAIIRRGETDLLHASFSHDHHMAVWAARGTGVPVFRTAHRRRDVEIGTYRRRLYRLSAGIVVHAESYRRILLERGMEEDRVFAIPGFVDAGKFTSGRSPALRREWGVGGDVPLAGIVARMKPERLHDRLLEAWKLVGVPGARLVIVGRGEDERRLRALAPDGVVFGGYRAGAELVEAYRALDVAVWLREGNDGACRGVLEAMACAVPVVVGNEGAPPELVGETGRVVDPQSPESIAESLRDLLGNLPFARRLGAAARARAQTFSPERYCENVLSFWRRLRPS